MLFYTKGKGRQGSGQNNLMHLTENRRIGLNVVVTYGRTLIDVVCSLFAVRWVLMALGQRDFGLYGVVGGLVVFMSFINRLFSSAVARFYGYELGRMSVDKNHSTALEECRKWFSTAVVIHVIIPTILVLVGYPLGEYAISNGWIGVPQDRVTACCWVWLFVCVDVFTAMLSAPIGAMFIAKQNISEATLYTMIYTIGRTFFIFCMTLVQREWLVPYALGICLIAQIPRICMFVHALCNFCECKFRWCAFRELWRFKKLTSFVGWKTFTGLGDIIKGQGIAMLVTRSFGASANAAMSIGVRLGGETAVLSSALQNAFAPAITMAYGAGDYEKMSRFAFRVCKYSTLLVMIIAIPMMIEIREVLQFWLKTPPLFSAGICFCTIVSCVVGRCTFGHTIAILATGDIAAYSLWHGLSLMSSIVIAGVFVSLGYGLYSVGVAIVIATALSVVGDIIIARSLLGMSICFWIKAVVCPLIIVTLVTAAVGVIPSSLMQPSLFRLFITTICCVFVFIPTTLLLLEVQERQKIYNLMRRFYFVLLRK